MEPTPEQLQASMREWKKRHAHRIRRNFAPDDAEKRPLPLRDLSDREYGVLGEEFCNND